MLERAWGFKSPLGHRSESMLYLWRGGRKRKTATGRPGASPESCGRPRAWHVPMLPCAGGEWTPPSGWWRCCLCRSRGWSTHPTSTGPMSPKCRRCPRAGPRRDRLPGHGRGPGGPKHVDLLVHGVGPRRRERASVGNPTGVRRAPIGSVPPGAYSRGSSTVAWLGLRFVATDGESGMARTKVASPVRTVT